MDFDVVRVVKNDKKHEGCCIPTDTAVSKSPISIAIMNEYVKFSRRKKRNYPHSPYTIITLF